MMVLMGIGVKGKYSAETGRLDNGDQIAAHQEAVGGGTWAARHAS